MDNTASRAADFLTRLSSMTFEEAQHIYAWDLDEHITHFLKAYAAHVVARPGQATVDIAEYMIILGYLLGRAEQRHASHAAVAPLAPNQPRGIA